VQCLGMKKYAPYIKMYMTAMLIPNEVRLFTVFNLFLFVTSHSLTIKKLYKKYLQARKTHTCNV
jgi:hypothetical protein